MYVLNPWLAIANHVLVSAVEISPVKDGTLGPNQRAIPLKVLPTFSSRLLHHVSGGTYPFWISQCLWRCYMGPREIKISKSVRKLLTVW